MDYLIFIGKIIGIIILAPIAGGLLSGMDRIISARMQRRKGPPLLQPFYDVIKLLQKKATTVNKFTRYYVTLSLFFNIFTVVLFMLGTDLLLCIFSYTLSITFFVIAGYSSHSPYSFIGAERELILTMCYEPMILIMAFCYYEAAGTFSIKGIFNLSSPLVFKLPFVFIGVWYVLTIKLRKSPFDLSTSHHGHQEIVKGITTELTGICYAMIEVMHWFETVFALGLIYLFFAYHSLMSRFVAVLMCLLIYFVEIIIDNTCARIKWDLAIKTSWVLIAITGGINLLILSLF